jgi:peptidoglycan hydrolase CwlO-like protein
VSNEEFQKLVLEELRSLKNDMSGLKEGQHKLEAGQRKLEEGQHKLEEGQHNLEAGQKRLEARVEKLERKLDAVYEQTAQLVEFRNEVNLKLDNIIEDNKSIHEILGEHEISIRTLRRRPV